MCCEGMNESVRVNGRVSPDAGMPGGSARNFTDGGGAVEAPPPVPVKKKKMQ